jgi:hypothetical protein
MAIMLQGVVQILVLATTRLENPLAVYITCTSTTCSTGRVQMTGPNGVPYWKLTQERKDRRTLLDK